MGMLFTEPLTVIEKQFFDKEMILDGVGEKVSPYDFYEDVFEDLETEVPIVILDDENDKRIQPMILEDAIAFSRCRNDVLLGGLTYFNNWISKKTAKDVHALIVDLDNVYSGVLMNAFQNDWRSATNEPIPKPSYIVNSGTGLHLYFVLNEKIPVYSESRLKLDELYRTLATEQSRRPYVKKDTLWFGQDFRMAGSRNKFGWENSVYKVGEKWDLDELAQMLNLDLHFIRYGEPKKTNKIIKSKRPKSQRVGWRTNRAFYDYTLRTCKDKTKEGNRYLSMCALVVIAYKCNVDFEEVQKDLYELLTIYNKDCFETLKEKEITSALKMYNSKAMETTRSTLENWLGWNYQPIKRNGRKQDVHLMGARAIQEINDKVNGTNWRSGNGRKSSRELVEKFQKENPNARKIDCIRELKLSKPTVYKWWGSETNE